GAGRGPRAPRSSSARSARSSARRRWRRSSPCAADPRTRSSWRSALPRRGRPTTICAGTRRVASATKAPVSRSCTPCPCPPVPGSRISHPRLWLLGLVAALLPLLRVPFVPPPPRTAAQVRQTRLLAAYALVFLAVACAYGSKNMRFLSPLYPVVATFTAILAA